MSLGLIELSSWRGRKTAAYAPVSHARPAVETLEERAVMASPASVAGSVGALLGAGQQTASFLPIDITGVTTQVVNGATQLVAQGTIAGQAFTAPITLSTSPSSTSDCPILHLNLGPINLNVLGLQVQTSPICLAIDASPGQGQLLGNLLCGLSHALDGGGTLGGFLGSLTDGTSGLTGTVNDLLGGVTSLLDGALGSLTNPATAAVLPSSTTNILHLSVGPLNLDLLGLVVNLDNCAGGPVTVDINAVSGPGNLLGNLLGQVVHLADHANVHALDQALARLGRDLLHLGL